MTGVKSKSVDRELKSKATAIAKAGAVSYQPTSKEAAVICKMAQELDVKAPVPKLKISDDGKQISLGHPSKPVGLALFMNAIGTGDPAFARGMMCQLAQISSIDGVIDGNTLNFAVSVVTGAKPVNQDESMSGVLKAAAYLCGVNSAARYQQAQTLIEAEHAERSFNKFTRTFAVLSEMQMRKRSSGEQNVIVQNNVAVNDNGQALVGNVIGQQTKTPPKQS